MASSNLTAIITKVRRLTRTPSELQLTDAEIQEYANTFIQYDMPDTLRLFEMRKKFSFYTEPYIDSYSTSADPTSPLYNFKNIYITNDVPAYISGVALQFVPDSLYFYQLYSPRLYNKTETTGDGVTANFTGTLSGTPILRNDVLFTSIDANNNGLKLYDNGAGVFEGDGLGTINYITGAYDITFTAAPGSGENVVSQTYNYKPARPESILYFEDTFVLRPIPDQVYRVDIEAYKRPNELLNAAQSPDLEHWWQYIAYGAAKKVFEDRMDTDSIQQIIPEMQNQQILVERRSIVQNKNKRERTMFNSGAPRYRRFW